LLINYLNSSAFSASPREDFSYVFFSIPLNLKLLLHMVSVPYNEQLTRMIMPAAQACPRKKAYAVFGVGLTMASLKAEPLALPMALLRNGLPAR